MQDKHFILTSAHHYGFTVNNLKDSVNFYCNTLGFQKIIEVSASGKEMEDLTGVEKASLKAVLLKFPEGEHYNMPVIELLEYVEPKGKAFDRSNNDVGNAHIALVVDNIDEAYSELLKKQVHFTCKPFLVSQGPLTGMKITYLTDPDGITIEMMGSAKP